MGFAADWLALREPADRAARDKALLKQAAQAAGPEPVILDLGCGTGSTSRAMADFLPEDTRWRLLDGDARLLEHAEAEVGGDVECVKLDLNELDALPLAGVTLVTASALLDLVSVRWVEALAARLEVPFYAALCYDGNMAWTPEDGGDAAVTQAFNRHQRSDKGLGPALGPQAGPRSREILDRASFDVALADSPWDLGPEMADLQLYLTDGIASAVAEAGLEGAAVWGAKRREIAGQGHCRIGHCDLLAIPRRTA